MPQKKDHKTKPPIKEERIAKVLARAGVASRREVERMIAEKRIELNGEVVTTPATLIANSQGITVDGNPVSDAAASKVWRYHKPKGKLTTHNDPKGRPTIFDDIPTSIGRVISVGRLDYNTEGLILLTNDGEISRWMELPETGWKRQYRVRVHGMVKEEALKGLRKGVTIEGVKYGEVEAQLERQITSNAWIRVAIREGKNREVRKILEHIGLRVTRLIRIAYGPFELGNLEVGKIQEISLSGLLESMPHNLIKTSREKLSSGGIDNKTSKRFKPRESGDPHKKKRSNTNEKKGPPPQRKRKPTSKIRRGKP